MSVIVALKYNNGVLIGADKQATCGNIKKDNAQKIYKMKYSNTSMGAVGYLRDANILETLEEVIYYKDILNKTKIDRKYVVSKVVPNLFENFENFNRVEEKNGVKKLLSYFIFCTNNKIFEINGDGAVSEHDNFLAMGCGEQLCKGYLDTSYKENLTKEQAEELISNAIKISCKDDCYIGNVIDWIDLKEG